jgi:uncharacterized membrane protein YphA (DoxX/SURF4 family)
MENLRTPSATRAAARVAGPLIGSIFIQGGWDSLKHPEGKIPAAQSVTEPLASHLEQHFEGVPHDAASWVRANGAVQVGAGSLLAVGKLPRLASLALLGSLMPMRYAGHRFWQEDDAERAAQQQIHFLKNLAVIGGLLLRATKPRYARHGSAHS